MSRSYTVVGGAGPAGPAGPPGPAGSLAVHMHDTGPISTPGPVTYMVPNGSSINMQLICLNIIVTSIGVGAALQVTLSYTDPTATNRIVLLRSIDAAAADIITTMGVYVYGSVLVPLMAGTQCTVTWSPAGPISYESWIAGCDL
jgi:hypothetical protein